MNVHIGINGINKNERFSTFPYEAVNPLTNKRKTFEGVEDIEKILIECYDKCIKEGVGGLGIAMYEYSRFFADDSFLLDNEMQNTIRKYRYCKKFSCPPRPSLDTTPIDIIDDFMLIDDEITQHQSRKKNG